MAAGAYGYRPRVVSAATVAAFQGKDQDMSKRNSVVSDDMVWITDRRDFARLATQLRVRPSWHEPDEQGLTARVDGRTFDNAGLPDELTVTLSVIDDSECDDGCEYACRNHSVTRDVARVSLATLCAWAAGYTERDGEQSRVSGGFPALRFTH